jgi:hypothetical protein
MLIHQAPSVSSIRECAHSNGRYVEISKSDPHGRLWPTPPFGHSRYRIMPIDALERNADISGAYGRS